MKVYNIDSLPGEHIAESAGLTTMMLSAAAGSERLYVHIDQVEPGMASTKYHSHTRQEEFFLILEGSGTLRLNDEEFPVSKGDFIAKPAGRNIAHTFLNTGSATLVILDVGTVEPLDECYYPDEGVTLHKENGERTVSGPPETVRDWTSEPNAER